MMESLCEVFFKTARIHYSMFDVGRSMFDVRCYLVSFLINLAARRRIGCSMLTVRLEDSAFKPLQAGINPATTLEPQPKK
jgi:hypothetical protein